MSPYRTKDDAPHRRERAAGDVLGVLAHVALFVWALVRVAMTCVRGLDVLGFIATVVVCLTVLRLAERHRPPERQQTEL